MYVKVEEITENGILLPDWNKRIESSMMDDELYKNSKYNYTASVGEDFAVTTAKVQRWIDLGAKRIGCYLSTTSVRGYYRTYYLGK